MILLVSFIHRFLYLFGTKTVCFFTKPFFTSPNYLVIGSGGRNQRGEILRARMGLGILEHQHAASKPFSPRAPCSRICRKNHLDEKNINPPTTLFWIPISQKHVPIPWF